MHGVKRTAPPSASARAARKEKEAAKLKVYKEAEELFFDIRDRNQLDEAALNATTNLLTLNPELYTVWNYRRDVILSLVAQPPSAASTSKEAKPDFFASLRSGPEPSSSNAGERSSSSSNTLDDQKRATQYQEQVKFQLLEDDLALTAHALRAHPKVYWIWNHRKWCLIELPDDRGDEDDKEADGQDTIRLRKEGKWRREMKLVDKMLELDSRNFHVWDYRRYLLSQIALAAIPPSSTGNIPPFPYSLTDPTLPSYTRTHHLALANSELSYTLRKIESNFSNFSAWHWRSKLLPCLWSSSSTDEKQKVQEEEFELLRQAIYTDPSDQSVWLYHSWLIAESNSSERQKKVLRREIESIEELVELEPDSNFCLEALSRYKTLLASLLLISDQEESKRFQAEARQHLETLLKVDPDRQGRWTELLQEQQQK